MKVLLLTQWFDPEPTLKGLAFARALADRGHDVQVLTGFPNYPGGRVYPGYRIKPWGRRYMDGICVTRVPLYPSHGRSVVGRIANYTTFALSASLGGLFLERPDVVYVYHPPATSALPALILKFLRGVPFVLDIQDLWPDTLAASGMLKWRAALSLVDSFCSLAFRSAARVAVLSPGFERALVTRGVPPSKIDVVYNWSRDAESRRPGLETNRGACDSFDVVFAGNMGHAQGLDSVLKAAAIVAQRDKRVRFVFIGGGIERDRLHREAANQSLSNVSFLPQCSAEQLAPLLAVAGALLVHLRDDPLFSMTIPSKTQSYLAAGRPIIMAVPGDAADLVKRAEGGVVVPSDDPDALAAAVCALSSAPAAELSAMGLRGRQYYDSHLSFEVGVDRFAAILKAATLG